MHIFPERHLKRLTAVLSLLLITAVLGIGVGCKRRSPSAPFKNIVLIIVDTLAVGHVGAYTPGVRTTPHIDSLASSGIVFKSAYSAAPWTKPAVSSVFTGLMPSAHGVKSIDQVLSEKYTTLAERVKERGFKTAGFISHILISPQLGYSQGFDSYQTIPFQGNIHDVVSSETVTDLGIKWLKDDARKDENPFFLFLHYFDPHNNYKHHPQFDRTSWYKGKLKPGMDIRELRKLIPSLNADDIRYLRDLYDEEVAFTDHQIGRFLATLDELGIRDETLVILTADHGEELLERGHLGHSRTLYNELIQVPLIFSLPSKFKPTVFSQPVSTVSISPTLIDFLGSPREEVFMAPSLKQTLLEHLPPALTDVYSEVDFRSSSIKAYKVAVINESKKLILDKTTQEFELYDLLTDPDERSNIASSQQAVVKGMSPLLTTYVENYQSSGASQNDSGKVNHSPEEVEQLKSLGYL